MTQQDTKGSTKNAILYIKGNMELSTSFKHHSETLKCDILLVHGPSSRQSILQEIYG